MLRFNVRRRLEALQPEPSAESVEEASEEPSTHVALAAVS
jgi:hypothetical protein